MHCILDTNVISEVMRPEPDPNVLTWIAENEGDLFLTAITIKELHFGILRLPDGKRKAALRAALRKVVDEYGDYTFSFDTDCAMHCAELHQYALTSGHTPTIEDLMIASICEKHSLPLATRNTKDFEYLSIQLINPWSPLPNP